MQPAVEKLVKLREITEAPEFSYSSRFVADFCAELAPLLIGERSDFAFEVMDNVRIKFLNARHSGRSEEVCRTLAEIFVRLIGLVDTPVEPSTKNFATYLDEAAYLHYLKPVLSDSLALALKRDSTRVEYKPKSHAV